MAFFEDTSISHDITTDAGFRTWGQMVAKGLKEVGLVQTADTGQIDWETVETPSSNNTDAGYEIWRFDDEDQATEPVFVKIYYGRAGAADRPRICRDVGTGSDGGGEITNGTGKLCNTVEGVAAETGVIHICYKDGALGIVTSHTPTNTFQIHVFVERGKHPITGELMGVIWTTGPTNAGDPWTSGVRARYKGSWTNTTNGVSYSRAATVADNLFFPTLGQLATPVATAPAISFAAALQNEIGTGEEGKLSVGGVERTYKRLPITMAKSIGLVNHNILVLHE